MSRNLIRAAIVVAAALVAQAVPAANVKTGLVEGREGEGQLTACFCDDGTVAIPWRPSEFSISWMGCKNACREIGRTFTAPMTPATPAAPFAISRGTIDGLG